MAANLLLHSVGHQLGSVTAIVDISHRVIQLFVELFDAYFDLPNLAIIGVFVMLTLLQSAIYFGERLPDLGILVLSSLFEDLIALPVLS